MNQADLVTAARAEIHELVASIWTDDQLETLCDTVVLEISYKSPLEKYANLPIIQYTSNVLVSGLTDLIKLFSAETPVGTRQWPLYSWLGRSEIILNLNIPTITSGVLAGTLTFTNASRAVTGVATAFTSLQYGQYGDLIGLSDGTKYYQIAYITSDTALTLLEPFAESTHTDDINVTKYRSNDSVARLTYGAGYSVVTASSDMPIMYDDLCIKGIVAKAATSYLSGYNIADVEVELDLANTSLDSGVGVINTLNRGGDEAAKYTAIANAASAIAQQRVGKNKDLASWSSLKIQEYNNELRKIGRMEFIPR
jgi:hypothetical protein